jgi:hypothetical protein
MRELHAVKVFGPDTHTKLAKPKLFIRGGRDRRLNRAAPGIATARLVDEIDGKTAA